MPCVLVGITKSEQARRSMTMGVQVPHSELCRTRLLFFCSTRASRNRPPCYPKVELGPKQLTCRHAFRFNGPFQIMRLRDAYLRSRYTNPTQSRRRLPHSSFCLLACVAVVYLARIICYDYYGENRSSSHLLVGLLLPDVSLTPGWTSCSTT